MPYMLNNPWHVVDTLQTLTEWINECDWQWYWCSLHQQLSSGGCNQMGFQGRGTRSEFRGAEACMPCAAGEREMQQTLQLMV